MRRDCGAFLTISLCVACEIYSLSLALSQNVINLRVSSYLFERRGGLFLYTRIRPDLVLIFCLECADSNGKILLSGLNLVSFCYCGFHIGIYKSCLMFYNGVESNGFIGFGAVVARRRDICR